jgi:WD40 repeat protein/DNA-binding SARP family transcriptional activator
VLEIHLLGQFSLNLDGKSVELPSRPAQSLLAYLALTEGIAHRREKLAGLLWPDIADADARRNLRRALWHIRKVLEGQAPLRADDISVAFVDGPQVWVDARTAVQKLSSERPVEELVRAVSAYGGELLPGFYDEWIIVERERLQAAFESRIKLLLDRLVEGGRWADVLEWGERWIALAGAAEPAYRALMAAYAGQGDLAGVGHSYQRCTEAMQRSLGVEPSDETRSLYIQLSSKRSVLPTSDLPQPGRRGDQAPPGRHPFQAEPGVTAPLQANNAGAPPQAADSTAANIPEEPPFKGLQFFDEVDAGLFFGREAITARLLERMGLAEDSAQGQDVLVIVGASGSGKSSLVRAGLIPGVRRLSSGKTPESAAASPDRTASQTAQHSRPPGWEVAVLTPSAHPLENLASVLTRDAVSVRAAAALMDDMAKDSRSLRLYLHRRPTSLFLVIDQMEEVFTLCREEGERQAFIDNLLAAAAGGGCKLVISLRADFYAHCARFENLRLALASSQEYIGPMNAAELRRAIEEPARVCEYTFETGLVDLILREVGGEPGLLPLLSHALLETWKRRQGRSLTLSGYAEAGGVRGAIAHTAERVYSHLASDEQRIARSIFLRLTELGEGAGAGGLPTPHTRRRATPEELVLRAEERECVTQVLNLLAEARLITVGEGSVEVAHEALIREWPALRGWLAEDRDGLRVHRRLTEAALSWEELEREPGELVRGARLAQASEWAAGHPAELNELEREFLAAARATAEREAAEREAARQREVEAAQRFAESEQRRAQDQARSARRFSWLAAGLAVLLLAAVILAGFTLQQRNQVRDQAQLATSRELAASAISSLQVDPERSMLLALQALRTAGTQEAENALHQAVQSSRLVSVIKTQNQWAIRVAVSPDGLRLAVTSLSQQSQYVTEIWDLTTGKRLFSLPGYLAANFWPDDRRQATGAGNAITFWDAQTGHMLSTVHLDRLSTEQAVYGNLSPDWTLAAESFSDGTIGIAKLDTGKRLLTLGKPGDPPGRVVEFSPDGQRLLAVVNNTTQIWDIHTGQVMATLPSTEFGIIAAAFAPREDLVALGIGPVMKIANSSTGQTLLTFSGHTGFVQGIHFSNDGTRLATAGADNQAIVWDAATGQALLRLAGHTAALVDLAFIPGSNHLATSGLDGTVRIWDISPAGGGEGSSNFDLYGQTYTSIAFSPDGTRLAVSGGSTAGQIFDASSGKTLLSLSGKGASWQGSAAFSPDGARLALTSGENDATIWDASRGSKLLTLSGHRAWIANLAFSPDGKRLASLSFDGQAKMWDAASGKELFSVQAFIETLDTTQILEIAFSPDGTRFVTAAGRTPKIWDTSTGKELLALPAQAENVYAAAFSPDGKRLAIGISLGGGASIWELSTGEKLAQLTGQQGSVQAVLFSRDGKQVITGSVDGTIKVWDTASGQEQLTLAHQTAQITGLALSPDGTHLAASGSDGTARVYLLRVDDLIAYALGRLTRWFTPQECLTYLHTSTCPSKP